LKYRITHKTLYRYNEAVTLCHNEAHLIPRDSSQQCNLGSTLKIEPLPAFQQNRLDIYGNTVSYFSIQSPHQTLTVTAISEIEIRSENAPNVSTHSLPWEHVGNILTNSLDSASLEAREFTLDSPLISVDRALYAYAQPSFTPNRPLLEAVRDLMKRIYTEFSYDPHFTTVVTSLAEVLEHRRGVCQDFAHLMIGCLRSMGLAARYVSGYLETLPPPGQKKLQGSDASHAWVAVCVPGQGWVDFDPTNNQIPSNQHITTAWGRDYSDVTPLKGIVFGGSTQTLTVAVDVERLDANT